MRALVKAEAAEGLRLEDVPEPEVGINDVLIRVHKTGICGTDLHIYEWDDWAAKTIPVPMVIGHEFVGEIVECGSNVSDFQLGDLVSGEGHVVCGRCRNCMAVAVVRHAGARHVVVTDLNPYRLDLARRMGATLALDPRERDLGDVQRELGMTEGFDVGLEMSGSPAALSSMIANMAHGGRIAVLGIPSEPVTLDLNPVIFDMLTIKGIYGREMYETWYQMSVMLESGLDIKPVITHRFSYRDYEEAFAVARSGDSGKVILDWTEA